MADTRDLVTGSALCALGAAMAIVARGFPTVGGMAYGPGLFPTIVAVGLVASGLGIAAEGLAAGRNRPDEDGGRRLGPLVGILAVIAFFALALDPLGFHIAAAISLLCSVRLFGGGMVAGTALALVGPVVLQAVFYSVLRVPLPWGLLLPVAW
ncbi:tripartite tricarboxylate transporter TctB family protein [Tranquillimonas rosea]|uniref:tripartite tricarboxylate transporter TctB family protein n=1 Tax=Tranquillimonas rosea TaxID=641238 RepID=UPI003BA9EFE7